MQDSPKDETDRLIEEVYKLFPHGLSLEDKLYLARATDLITKGELRDALKRIGA